MDLENMVKGGNKIPKENAAIVYKLLDPAEGPKERLYPAGTVYYANTSKENGKYEVRYLPTEELANMFLSGRMFSDHMPQSYAKLKQ